MGKKKRAWCTEHWQTTLARCRYVPISHWEVGRMGRRTARCMACMAHRQTTLAWIRDVPASHWSAGGMRRMVLCNKTRRYAPTSRWEAVRQLKVRRIDEGRSRNFETSPHRETTEQAAQSPTRAAWCTTDRQSSSSAANMSPHCDWRWMVWRRMVSCIDV